MDTFSSWGLPPLECRTELWCYEAFTSNYFPNLITIYSFSFAVSLCHSNQSSEKITGARFDTWRLRTSIKSSFQSIYFSTHRADRLLLIYDKGSQLLHNLGEAARSKWWYENENENRYRSIKQTKDHSRVPQAMLIVLRLKVYLGLLSRCSSWLLEHRRDWFEDYEHEGSALLNRGYLAWSRDY